ncbi:MAG TPA: terminase small subunit [Reyranella sp.]|nr:terminase small subunit [Reyranella sp.]
MTDTKPLPPKQARFVELYVVDLNASKAYREAYNCTDKVAETNGPRLLGNARVAEAIKVANLARSERTGITADEVIRDLIAIVRTDRNELVENQLVPCRYCYGKDFKYQFTPRELDRVKEAYDTKATKKTPDFDSQGGVGYTIKKAPNPACPECFGDGIHRVVLKDSRRLSPGAKLVYSGVKETKDGFEMKMESREFAWSLLAKHLGIGEPKTEAPEDAEERARLIQAELDAMDQSVAKAA